MTRSPTPHTRGGRSNLTTAPVEYIPLPKRPHQEYERYEDDFPVKNPDRARIAKVLTGAYRRCYHQKTINFHRWGGRGIRICSDWYDSVKRRINYRAFILWAISTGWKPGLCLDRIDNDGDYSPSNCRWVTNQKNNRNRSTNRVITYKGETHCLKEWAEIIKVPYSTLKNRAHARKTVEQILDENYQIHAMNENVKYPGMITFNGITLSKLQWDHRLGLPNGTVHDRLVNCGWSVEKALTEENHHGHNRFIEYNGEKRSIKEWSLHTGVPYRCLLNRMNRGWEFGKAISTPADSRFGTKKEKAA